MVGRLWDSLSDGYPLPDLAHCIGYGLAVAASAVVGWLVVDVWLAL